MPTSVPVWAASAPGLDLSGRDYAVLAVGRAAAGVTAAWLADLRAHGPRRVQDLRIEAETDADRGIAWADQQARTARVGWRFAVAGPEDVVLRACAAVRGRGALDAEITAYATSTEVRRVRCAHCRSTTTARVELGALTRCAGCGVELVVDAHLSRHHGSYLGYQPDVGDRP